MIILLTIFSILPLLGVILTCFFYFFPNKKHTLIYSLILGFIFGIFAYYLIPPNNYDLYHHHAVVSAFMNNSSFSYFLNYVQTSSIDILTLAYSYLIAYFGNIDLLQFFIVIAGYSIILYILRDYRNEISLKTIYFIPIVLYIVFGFYVLYFISGLFYYIALIIFALGFYLDYVKHKSKFITYPLYIIPIFIHNTLIYPLILLIMFKLFKEKIDFKKLIIILLAVIFSNVLIEFFCQHLDISFLTTLNNMFRSYMRNNKEMKRLYSGVIFFIEISKLIFTFVIVLFQKKKKTDSKIIDFIMLLSVCTSFLMIKSIVLIRFIMLIQFIGIVPILDYFKRKDNHVIVYIVMCALAGIYVIYFIHVMKAQNFGNIFDNLFSNIVEIFRK